MLVTSNFSFSHNVIFLKTDNTNLLILSLLSAKFIVLISSRFKFCVVKLNKPHNLSHIKFRGLQVLTIYLGKFHIFFLWSNNDLNLFLLPHIERSGAYCCTVVRLSVHLSVCLHKLNMKT